MNLNVMHGDSYAIPFKVTADGAPVTPDMVEELEVSIGSEIQRYLSKDELFFDESSNTWYFRLTQEETFAAGDVTAVYVRAVFSGTPNNVVGAKAGYISATSTGSAVVL